MIKIIIEGLDRLGKGTLIQGLQNELGFATVIHYGKPEKLKSHNYSLFEYQRRSFENGFYFLDTNGFVIFDRFHLGEYVYSPLYRNYSGEYVFDQERDFGIKNKNNVFLVLLTTSNLNIMQDDGQSHDYLKRGEEQEKFKEAFNMSEIKHKIVIDVHDGFGHYKDKQYILEQVLHFLGEPNATV